MTEPGTIPCLGIRGCACGLRHYLAREYGHPSSMREVPTFTDLVIRLALHYGLQVMHVPDSRRVGMAGWPDLTIKGTGGFWYRELKSQTGTLALDQREVGALLTRAGCDWAVWRPHHLYNGHIEGKLEEMKRT